MAEVLDTENSVGEIEAVEQAAQGAPKESPLDSLPEKYRGKKIEDVIKMHQETEKLMSKHAQEVGEVRKLADELIKSQLNKPKVEDRPEEVDYFEDPKEAVRRAVESNPAVVNAHQMALKVQQQMALQTLATKHPDYREVDSNNEFQDWVKSSRIRQQIYQSAQAFDVDAADELIGTWKQLKATKQRAINEVEIQARDSALTAAAVDTTGTNETSKKIYRRAEIMNLRVHNPRKFEAMRDEIEQAYAEGRVK